MTCAVRLHPDQCYRCARCGLQWDASDPEPPRCRTPEQLNRETGLRTLAALRELLRHKNTTPL